MFEIITVVLMALTILALSWAITIGLIFLICLCFAWEFSLLTATGVWLILLLVTSFLPSNRGNK